MFVMGFLVGVNIGRADETNLRISHSDLFAAFELNQESLESYDVLVVRKELFFGSDDSSKEKEIRHRIRNDIGNDRLLSVIFGSDKLDESTKRYANCLIADGQKIKHDIDLYRNKTIPRRSPPSLKYCFLTQFVPEFRTTGLADFPGTFKYPQPDVWREQFIAYKAKQTTRVKLSGNRAEVACALDKQPFLYTMTFDLTRNLIVHREVHQLVRSPKDKIIKKLFMFEESIDWTEINGVYVPSKLRYFRSVPTAGMKMDSEQREVHFTWFTVNEDFSEDAFDVSLGDSYQDLEKLVSPGKQNRGLNNGQ